MEKRESSWLTELNKRFYGFNFELKHGTLYFGNDEQLASDPRLTLSFETVPVDIDLCGSLGGIEEVRFSGISPNATLALHLKRTVRQDIPTVSFDTTANCQLIASSDCIAVALHGLENCASRTLRKGYFLVGSIDGIPELTIEGGSFNGQVDVLTVSGGSRSNPILLSESRVNHIVVDGPSVVSLKSEHFSCTSIEASDDSAKLTVQNYKSDYDADTAGPLSVGRLSELSVQTVNANLTVTSELSNIQVCPGSYITIGSAAIGERITFREPSEGLPYSVLEALKLSTLTQISGPVVLRSAQAAYLEGSKSGFTIIDVTRRSGGRGAPSGHPEVLCEGATIRNFLLPKDSSALSTLNLLGSAETLSPHTRDLPGWEFRLLGRGKTPDLATLQRWTAVMRRMRELAREKGATGAARTKVGWCAQRLRHLTVDGKTEGLALWGYRSLGYGERPLPALTTWLILAMLFAVLLSLPVQWESEYLWSTLGAVIDQAIGPIGSLTSSDSESFYLSQNWQYLIRALIAVPLLVGILSLRNYVRPGK